MFEHEPPRRPTRREVAAAATREAIVHAARDLFVANGYPATTIAQVAEAAGVAVQTVYSSVGSKPALALALDDLIDTESGIGPVAARVATSGDPDVVLVSAVEATRRLNERCGDIVQVLLAAGPSDPDVAAAVEEGMRRHRSGAELFGRRLAELGALRPGVSVEDAVTTFAVLCGPASWRQLTQEFGWGYDQAEAWAVASLRTLLQG